MTNPNVTLTIPQYLYDRARRLVEKKSLPVEEMLVEQLEKTLIDLPTQTNTLGLNKAAAV